jgi:aryl-alcohol dehydrogenase-like predicted oxidoreductase
MREFGGTGIRASVVGLGCNNFGIYQNAAQAVAIVRKALDVGINFLDMAGEHGSGLKETLVAEALGPRRKEVIIATKFGQAELLGLKDGDIVFSAANGLTPFATMEANYSILGRDAEKAIIQ